MSILKSLVLKIKDVLNHATKSNYKITAHEVTRKGLKNKIRIYLKTCNIIPDNVTVHGTPTWEENFQYKTQWYFKIEITYTLRRPSKRNNQFYTLGRESLFTLIAQEFVEDNIKVKILKGIDYQNVYKIYGHTDIFFLNATDKRFNISESTKNFSTSLIKKNIKPNVKKF